MLNSVVGPRVAATDLKSPLTEKSMDKDVKGKGPESSFGKALDDKLSSKPEPKDTKQEKKAESQDKKSDGKLEDPKLKKKSEPEVARAEEKPTTKKATGRQQAIKDFMDSFESEFDIPPTRLVEAMAKLDDSQLKENPEITAQAVIDQLDLPPEDEQKAQAMYASLLAQLNQMPVPAKSPDMVTSAGLTKQGIQDRIVSAQGRQDMMLKSVDQLNSKFWANPNVPAQGSLTGAEEAAQLGMQNGLQNLEVDEASFATDPTVTGAAAAPLQTPGAAESLLDKLPPHLQGQMKEAMSPALLAALAAKQQAAAAQQNQEGEELPEEGALSDEFQQALQSPKAQTPLLAGMSVQAKNQAGAEQFSSSQEDSSSLMQQNSQQNLAKASGSAKSEGVEGILKKADFKTSLTGMEAVHGTPIKGESLKAEMGLPVAAPVTPGAPTQAEHEAAVKQVMNQAQYLIKNGGGEMKVQMTPEGMGTIHLKVMLQDGKVNMQMSADTQEAKKTIESSLAELKTSLAAHKLSVENVKVDVVNSTSTDTATQNQTNMNGQHQRDQQTRQFWNQFNDNFGSQGRQESLMAFQQANRGYGKQRDPLQPIETASKASGRKVEGKGSGINLVA